MKISKLYGPSTVLLLLSLAACGGEPGSGAASPPGVVTDSACIGSLAGGGTQVSSPGCVNCTISNERRAIDGVAGSHATVRFEPAHRALGGAVPGTAMLRATAQTGIVFPAGNTAGAIMVLGNDALFHPNGTGADPAPDLVIRTYLGAVLQERAPIEVGDPDRSAQLYGFRTTREFDAVEIELNDCCSNSCCGFERPPAYIYEFCSQS